MFRYRSEFYSFVKIRSLLHVYYRFVATDTPYQQRNSLEELCEQVDICDGILLADAIEQIEVPREDDPAWETYEAVRHSAIVYGNEIHFLYRQRSYWISHTSEGRSHFSDDLGNTQDFPSCRDLFQFARIDGKSLKDLWKEVVVDAC